MKAVVLDRFGEPGEVLAVREVPMPAAGPGQVRVRMLASPINPSDLFMIRGQYAKLPTLPATPGFEGVGVVEEGQGLFARMLVGRRVAVLSPEDGKWKEQVAVPARQVVPVSDRIPLEQAAMFFVNPATAFVMVRCILAVPQNAWLLQTAANSALGRMVIRLGRHYGFRTLNVVRRPELAQELRGLGAHEVLVASPQNLIDQVRQATAGKFVSYAIDPVGGALGSAVIRCLAPGGRMLVYGTLAGQPLSFSPRDLMTPGARIEGFWLGRWMQDATLLTKLRIVRSIGRLIREGVLDTRVDSSFPLERIGEAVHEAEKPGRTGKVLLTMATA